MNSPNGFRYIGKSRRTQEDPRFVTGRGRYVADIALPGMKHVAIVASPYASARITAIRSEAARAAPGVHYVLTGEEFCAATEALAQGIDAPEVKRYALARDVVRYSGEWVVAVVADTRALAEDAAERCGSSSPLRATAETSACVERSAVAHHLSRLSDHCIWRASGPQPSRAHHPKVGRSRGGALTDTR